MRLLFETPNIPTPVGVMVLNWLELFFTNYEMPYHDNIALLSHQRDCTDPMSLESMTLQDKKVVMEKLIETHTNLYIGVPANDDIEAMLKCIWECIHHVNLLPTIETIEVGCII